MKRAGIRLFLAACAVLLVGLSAFNVRPSSAQDGEEKYVYATVYVCDEHFPSVEEMEAQCGTLDGASIYFTTHDGTEYGACLTEGGFCGFDLPIDQTVTIILDAAAPDGYYLDGYHAVTRNVADLGPDSVRGMPIFVFYPLSDFEGQTIGIGAAVQYCEEDPREPGVSVYESCGAGIDVSVTFSDSEGTPYFECTTTEAKIEGGSYAGYCGTEVPLGSQSIISLDLSTTDPNYTIIEASDVLWQSPSVPPDAPLEFPVFTFVRNEVVSEEPPAATEAPDESGAETPSETTTLEGRTVILYTGDCDSLGEEVATLNDVLPEIGEVVGDEKATTAEMSNTLGALFFLDVAIDEGMALVVYEDETTSTPVACGELGGVNTHDGMLPIGLAEVDDSGIVGTAVLSYNDVDETTTDVTIVISAELLPEPSATPGN